MIHENIMNRLKDELPKLAWTINFYSASDHTGTVYDRSGSGYMRGDLLISNDYQVFLRSSNWGLAEYYAYRVSEILEGISDEIWDVYFYDENTRIAKYTVRVRLIQQRGDVLFLGIDDTKIAEYSINFNAVLEIINKERL